MSPQDFLISYQYVEDFKQLELRGKTDSKPISSSGKWNQIVTPGGVEEVLRALPLYFYIVNGLSEHFQIGFDYQYPCIAAKSNMLSALRNTPVVEEYLKEHNSHQLHRRW